MRNCPEPEVFWFRPWPLWVYIQIQIKSLHYSNSIVENQEGESGLFFLNNIQNLGTSNKIAMNQQLQESLIASAAEAEGLQNKTFLCLHPSTSV